MTNQGVRVASQEVINELSKGEAVDPSQYYFRTTPTFKVQGENKRGRSHFIPGFVH